MDGDVLVGVAAAVAGAGEAGRQHEREAFRRHARRGKILAPLLDELGVIAGFLLQLAAGGRGDAFAGAFVADQAGGKFEAGAAERHAILFDEQQLPLGIDRDDHRGADAAVALGIFPGARLADRQVFALPHRIGRHS